MIGISKLYCGTIEPSDALRYHGISGKTPSHLLQFSTMKAPVVVWNVTRKCNLRCIHCYSESENRTYSGELTTEQGQILLDDLATFGTPVILFSGGEPLLREDLFELAGYAVSRGMRTVISTNGTLLSGDTVARLKDIGISYVGISLDGMRETHDRFRRSPGSFDAALAGINACREADIKVGVRFTITRRNVKEIQPLFSLIEEMSIPRICFYHLVHTGRGEHITQEYLNHEETRKAVDLIINLTSDLHMRNKPTEVLTVDNHTDAPYLYLRLRQECPERAEKALELLKMNGGNGSGVKIGCVSWDGQVYADQFWRTHSFGNVKKRPLRELWTDLSNPLMAKLKEKKQYVKGRCAKCKWLDICGGNLRARAEALTGDTWAPDPACYLTDDEIGLENP